MGPGVAVRLNAISGLDETAANQQMAQCNSSAFRWHLADNDAQKGFPDDRIAFGPTIASEASLQEMHPGNWFPELTLESLRRRFRTNLELGGGEVFCEDRLFGAPEELKPFRIGAVLFAGHNPCQRCVVPTRDPDSGEPVTEFQKKFMQLRKEHLPEWANVQRFNHFYRFAINTSIPPSEAGRTSLRVGDALTLTSELKKFHRNAPS